MHQGHYYEEKILGDNGLHTIKKKKIHNDKSDDLVIVCRKE
jgi:hypothetical protein